MEHTELVEQQKNMMNIGWEKTDISKPKNELLKYLSDLPMDEGLKLIGSTSVKGKTILSICAGSGYEADYFYALGAHVTATDISETACKKIKERNPHIHVQVENAENLSFIDESFDYVIVRAGLHHLPRPMIGVYEMLRVAKKGILIMEAQDSLIMRLLRKLGLVLEIEPSGNYVYTFSRREIEKVCKTLFLPDPTIKTYFYQYIPLLNNKFYTKLNGKGWQLFFKATLNFLNFFLGRWGNNFICFITKK